MDEKFYNASLNLLSKQMNFDKDLVEYLEHEFLIYICTRLKSSQISEFPYYFVNCQCNGKQVEGMPEIVLSLRDKKQLRFTSQDYFLFPTHKDSTSAVNSKFGLSYGFYNERLNLKSHRNESETFYNFNFGQLFVQKYGLILRFDQNNQTMLIFRTSELDNARSFYVIFWYMLFMAILTTAFISFDLQKYRLREEQKVYYKIYLSLVDQNVDILRKPELVQKLKIESLDLCDCVQNLKLTKIKSAQIERQDLC